MICTIVARQMHRPDGEIDRPVAQDHCARFLQHFHQFHHFNPLDVDAGQHSVMVNTQGQDGAKAPDKKSRQSRAG